MSIMKQWIANLRMTNKLLVSPFAAVVCLVIFGIAAGVGFYYQKNALNDIFNNRFKNSLSSASVIINLKTIHAKVSDLMSMIKSTAEASKTTKKDSASDAYFSASMGTADSIKRDLDKTSQEQFASLKEVIDTIQGVLKSPSL